MAITYTDDKLVKGSEMLELYRGAGWSLLQTRDPELLERAVRNSERFLMARDGAKLVGFLMAITDGTFYAHVTEFLVRPSHRDKVPLELFSRLRDSLPEIKQITLFCEPDSDSHYSQLDFRPYAGGFLWRRS